MHAALPKNPDAPDAENGAALGRTPHTGRRGRLRREWLQAGLLFLVLMVLHGGRPFLMGRVAPAENYVHLPNCAVSIECLREGVPPLWNPYVFCGLPHLASHHAGALYPPVYVLFGLLPPFRAFGLMVELHYFFMGLGMWALLRFGWRLRQGAALAGGVFFMLSGFTVAHEVHAPMIWAIAWIPWILWLSRRVLAGRRGAGTLLAAALAMQVGAGYMQMTVMTCLLMGLEALALALAARPPWPHAARRLATWALAATIGLGLMSVQYLSTAEMLPMTHREVIPYTNFTSHGFPLAQLPTLFFPLLLGVSEPFLMVKQLYFGTWDQPEMICSLGAAAWLGVLLLLFKGGAAKGEPRLARPGLRRPARFWAGVILFALLVLPGQISPINQILYHLPVIKLFRVQNRWFLFASIGLSILSAMGYDRMIGLIERRRTPRLGRAIAAGLLLLALAIPAVWAWIRLTKDQEYAWLNPDRFPGWEWFFRDWFRLANPALWLPALFGLAALAVLILIWRRPSAWRMGLILLVGLYAGEQGILLSHVVLRMSSPAEWHTAPGNGTAQWLLERHHGRADEFRTLTPTPPNVILNEESLIFFLPALSRIYGAGGYWPFMWPAYGRLLKMNNIGSTEDPLGLLARPAILSLLNIRYILVGHWFDGWWPIEYRPDLPKTEFMKALETPGRFRSLRKVHMTERGTTIFENIHARPRAWLVQKLIPAPGQDWIIERLWNDAKGWFDPARAAFIETLPGMPLPARLDGLATGTVETIERKPDRLRLRVRADGGPAFLVLSEAWYPGWWARVSNAGVRNAGVKNADANGALVPIHRVNAVLRGLNLPAGESEVYLRYLPPGFVRGLKLSLVFFLLWCAGLVYAIVQPKRGRLRHTDRRRNA